MTSRERRIEEEADLGRNGDGDLLAASGIEMEIARDGVANAMMREDHIGGITESDRASVITDVAVRVLEVTRSAGLLALLNALGTRYETEALLPNPPAAARGPEIETSPSHIANRRGPGTPRSHIAGRRGPGTDTSLRPPVIGSGL